mmetsp:Transcript_34887/g.38589  ORF Transcript_34887/g.38589 Transcript_34887/m.38589 type:complete len:340 (+) Transcript_34887:77-1096(+)
MRISFALAALAALSPSATAFQPATSFSTTAISSSSSTTTCLPLAFGLPDEDRQLPQPVEEDSSVADETLASLVEKMDQSQEEKPPKEEPKKKDNNSMAFLRKMGRVGGAANKSFVNAVGSDEGSTGRQPPAAKTGGGARKSKQAYQECTQSGVVDDLSEAFPMTSSGSEWRGITDRVMGGRSDGMLKRETDLEGRPANVLAGHVSLANGGGFLQMVTDLSLDASKSSVDASDYDGIEVDVLYRPAAAAVEDDSHNSFNIHVRTPGTFQQASYRCTFQIPQPNAWETIRVPFDRFEAFGGGPDMPASLDPSEMRRIGIVGIGEEMDLFLAVGGLRFYSVF